VIVSPPARRPFQGALQILQFNWPFYAIGLTVIVAAVLFLAFIPLPSLLKWIGWMGVALAAFWTVGSLAVSWYVYDYSPLYRWEWLAKLFPQPPNRWANFHTGLDESTTAICALFPEAAGEVFDFYEPATMSEPSIQRARRWTTPPEPPTPVTIDRVPIEDAKLDVAFVLFAAHEIRDPRRREQFFDELRRLLRPGGRIVLVEHLRDTANFVAFGPGSLHFWPGAEWRRLADHTGLHIAEEFSMTPFVRVFVLERPTDR